ncbi:MAG: tetratricopeptide repeat protein [Chlorobiales bacterium]|nr:tetratricopeptide repeat protein [Chlorobiales bacterium]
MKEIQTGTPVLQNVKPLAEDNLLYFAIKYKTAFIAVLVLLVCIGTGSFFWMRHQQTSEQEAALQLSRIAPLLDRGEYKAAISGVGSISGLKKISDDYSGTPSGNMASLLLGNAYYSIKDFDSALKVFKSVSIKNNDLAAAAFAGAGDSYVGKNQLGQAADAYQEASKKAENTVLKAQYLDHAADSYQAINQLQKASELYTKIIADYPGSTGAALAQRSLWKISGRFK